MEALKELLPLITTTPLWLLAALAVGYIIFKGHFFDAIDRWHRLRNREIDLIRAQLQSDLPLSDDARALLSEELETKLIEKILGVKAEGPKRKALLKLRGTLGPNFSLSIIRLADPHLEVNEAGDFHAKPDGLWKNPYWKWSVAGLMFTIITIAAIGLSTALFGFEKEPELALFVAVFAVTFLFLGRPIIEAHHSIRAVEKVNKRLTSLGGGAAGLVSNAPDVVTLGSPT